MKEPIVTLVYSHGRQGSPWHGLKIEALRPIVLKLGINIVSVKYDETTSAFEMEEKLFAVCKDEVIVPGDLILLGSSRGGYFTTKVSKRINHIFKCETQRVDGDKKIPFRHLLGVFLIAPAFYIKPEFYIEQEIEPADVPISIVHGYSDELIPYTNSLRFSEKFQCQLNLIKGGHRLNSQIPLLGELFSIFLKNCLDQAKATFHEWKLENPEDFFEAD